MYSSEYLGAAAAAAGGNALSAVHARALALVDTASEELSAAVDAHQEDELASRFGSAALDAYQSDDLAFGSAAPGAYHADDLAFGSAQSDEHPAAMLGAFPGSEMEFGGRMGRRTTRTGRRAGRTAEASRAAAERLHTAFSNHRAAIDKVHAIEAQLKRADTTNNNRMDRAIAERFRDCDPARRAGSEHVDAAEYVRRYESACADRLGFDRGAAAGSRAARSSAYDRGGGRYPPLGSSDHGNLSLRSPQPANPFCV